LLEAHVGVTVAELPSLYAAVAVTVTVAPTNTGVADAFTSNPVTVTSAASTVILTESLWPANVPVTVAVPAATAVTVPSALTVATVASLEVHVGVTAAVVSSL